MAMLFAFPGNTEADRLPLCPSAVHIYAFKMMIKDSFSLRMLIASQLLNQANLLFIKVE